MKLDVTIVKVVLKLPGQEKLRKGLADVLQAKTEIAAEVKEALQKSMESFGFIIIETLVSVAGW